VRAVRNIDSTKVTPITSKNLPRLRIRKFRLNREFECGLGLEIVQGDPGYEEWRPNLRPGSAVEKIVESIPLKAFFQEIHIIGIYKGRGSNDRFVQDGSHYMRNRGGRGACTIGNCTTKLDARRAAESKNWCAERWRAAAFTLLPGKLLGEILEALKIQVESAGASNPIGFPPSKKRAAVTGPTIGMRYSTFSRSLNVHRQAE